MAASPVTAAKPCLNALSSNALRLHRKVRQNADSTGERRRGLEPQKADSVVQLLKQSTALKRAKREPNGHWACVGFGS